MCDLCLYKVSFVNMAFLPIAGQAAFYDMTFTAQKREQVWARAQGLIS